MELTKKLIDKLLGDKSSSPKISIYIPTHPKSTSQSVNEDRIRFKNALQKIEHEPAVTEGELAGSFQKLVALTEDTEFWLHQSISLAVFADANDIQTVKLPYELTPCAAVLDQYIVSPLLAIDSIGSAYYLLDINLKTPQLYTGTSHGLKPVKEEGILGPIEDVIDTGDRKASLDFRAGDAGGSTMFYGSNAGEQPDNDAAMYLQLLADEVDKHLTDQSLPLLLAGTDNRVAQMRRLLKYRNVLDHELPIDRDSANEPELHAAAEEIVTELTHARRAQQVEDYLATDFERKADGLTAVSAAAEQGKVDRLYLPIIRMTTDSVDQSSPVAPLVELPDDIAKFESAVRAVAAQGGQITAVEQDDFADDPTPKALLRY